MCALACAWRSWQCIEPPFASKQTSQTLLLPHQFKLFNLSCLYTGLRGAMQTTRTAVRPGAPTSMRVLSAACRRLMAQSTQPARVSSILGSETCPRAAAQRVRLAGRRSIVGVGVRPFAAAAAVQGALCASAIYTTFDLNRLNALIGYQCAQWCRCICIHSVTTHNAAVSPHSVQMTCFFA